MKRLFIISLLFLSVGFCQNKNDEPNPMKGVKTQIESIYEFEEKFGEFNDIFKGETISRYDPNGNKVESSWYDSDGNLTNNYIGISKTISRYDSNGNELESSWYDSDGSLDSKAISKYNSNGNKVESSWYDSDGSIDDKYIYTYDSNGNQVEKTNYDSDGSLIWKTISKYNSNGNEVEWSWYDSDGPLMWKTIYTYDSNGNQVEQTEYDSEGSLKSKYISKYDSNGNKVEQTKYDSEGSLKSKYISKYDSNGNKVEQTKYDSEGSLKSKYISKYDSKNRIVELIKYNFRLKFGQLQQIPTKKYTYEYEEYIDEIDWDAPLPPPSAPKVKFIPYDDPPRAIGGIRPVYPEIEQDAGIEGVVVVQAFIDEKGRVKETIILKGIPNTGLDEAAMEAIRKTRFKPAKQRKRPVGVWISIPVNFKLK